MEKAYKAFKLVTNFKTREELDICIGSYVEKGEAIIACLKDIQEVEKTYNKEVSFSYIYKTGSILLSCIINDLNDAQGVVITFYRVLSETNAPYILFKNTEIQGHYYSVEEAINYLNTIVPSTKLHNALNILTVKENQERSPLYNDTKPILAFKGNKSKHHYDFNFDFYYLYKNQETI